jgi:hypothetical protein
VLAQTFRTMIHSRLDVGMEKYRVLYPEADIVLFEPGREDAHVFHANPFSYGARRQLCEHAYRRTRAQLLARRHELAPLLARHGVTIDLPVLRDPHRTLVRAGRHFKRLHEAEADASAARVLLDATLDDLQAWLARDRSVPAA